MMLSAARRAMASLVSTVALPRWGQRMTYAEVFEAGGYVGLEFVESRAAPIMCHSEGS
jgi:hypothetical protein